VKAVAGAMRDASMAIFIVEVVSAVVEVFDL
jgi:hypothetical protein